MVVTCEDIFIRDCGFIVIYLLKKLGIKTKYIQERGI
jgi:hypothetical protein